MATAVAVIAVIISVGAAIYASNIDISQDDTGRSVNRKGTGAPRSPIYGTTRTTATPVYNNVKDDSSETLIQVFACGVGEITGIRQLYIDDVAVIKTSADPDGTGYPWKDVQGDLNSLLFPSNQLSNGFEKQCEVQLRTGRGDSVAMQLAIDNGDGDWTTSMRGERVLATTIKSQRIIDDEEIRIVDPSYPVSMLVDGLALYDPRYNASVNDKQFEHGIAVPVANRECGRNPALCGLDYLTDSYYGMTIPYVYINVQSFMDAANYCDSNAFKCDGQPDSSESFAQALDSIAKCANLIFTIELGQIHCKFEQTEIPSHDFDESNIESVAFTVIEQSSSNYTNVVEVEYKDSSADDQQEVFTIPEDVTTDPTILSDGYISTSTMSLPFVRYDASEVNDAASVIRRLANIELNRQQFQKQVRFDVDLSVYPVKIYEVITVTDENLNWNAKEFRVTDIQKKVEEDKFLVATITAIEYDESIYTNSLVGANGGGKPGRTYVQSPSGFNISYDAGLNTFAKLTWNRTWFEVDSVFYIQYKKQLDSIWHKAGHTVGTEWIFDDLDADVEYDYRVATYSPTQGLSEWVELNQSAHIVSTPTNLQWQYRTGTAGDLTWQRTHSTSNAVDEVRYSSDGGTSFTTLGTTDSERWQMPILFPGSYVFSVRTKSNIYGLSTWSANLEVDVGSLGVIPSVTSMSWNSIGGDFTFTWTDMLSAPVSGIPNDYPTGTVADVFSHYQVDIKHSGGGAVVQTYTVFDPSLLYSFEANKANGLSRQVYAEVYVVAVNGQKSSLGSGSINAVNSQHTSPSGFAVDTALSTSVFRWNDNFQPDYSGSIIQRSTTGTGSWTDIGHPIGTNFSYIWPDAADAGAYFRVGHYDVFDSDSLNYSPSIFQKPTSIDDLLPEFPDELSDIRDPSREQTSTGEMIMNVASPDRKTVTGFGMYATDRTSGNDVESGKSRFIVAADEFVIATGGHSTWDSTESYVVGDRVSYVISDTVHRIYEALTNNTNKDPVSNGSDWVLKVSNSMQSAFYIDSVTGSMYVRNATIKDLSASTITTGTFGAGVIYANSITGDQITSTSTITAGTVTNQKAFMSGAGTYRFWCGHDTSSSAPFRVAQDGSLTASKATIDGDSVFAGRLQVQSSPTGGRLEIVDDQINVYNASGTLVVRLGRIT